ncbi:N-acetyl-gamma-glutamyl-phosphate reductase [Ekhidna sp.]|uniref:N-acetyl-gamma-glutamyl-phosphate reductase n=1 Tax=Ekhidna sp. TaxID=2608089 RepID=UPI003BAAB222
MIKAGIIGAAGYTAGELIRILIHHPEVEITLAQSGSQSGKLLSEVHQDLIGETGLSFSEEINKNLDVVFLCKGHGESVRIIKENPFLLNKKVIDLSQDFRLKGTHDFTYGLPELNRDRLRVAKHIANPGCFATSIQLGLLPAIQAGLVDSEISISGITGSTGAGQSLSSTSHFSWRSNNASVYKPLRHQHLNEIGETIASIATSFDQKLLFVPYRGAFTRGIITTSHFHTSCTEQELIEVYQKSYGDHPFTHVVPKNPDLKQVIGSNKCLVYPQVIDGRVIIVSVIDNLLKGASGQAVQNMNLQFGLEETTGLKLKSIAF